MSDEAVKSILAILCVLTGFTSMFFCMMSVEQRVELKFMRQTLDAKEQVIDEQNSTIIKLLEHIKYLRGE